MTNSGNVTASNHGFLMEAGGTVTNNAGASITVGNTGVFFKVQHGTVINSGNISGTGTSGTGVYLENNGNITNTSTGTITGAVFSAPSLKVAGAPSAIREASRARVPTASFSAWAAWWPTTPAATSRAAAPASTRNTGRPGR